MSSSDMYSYETELEDWVEMLMRYMLRHGVDTHTLMWDVFRQDYPSIAADMEWWLEKRHEENESEGNVK